MFALLFAPVHAQDTASSRSALSPDQLFVEAIVLFQQAAVKSEGDAAQDLQEVARIFQKIQTDFPNSVPASLIAQGGMPGGVDLSRLPAAESVAAAQVQAAVLPPGDLFDLSDTNRMMAFLQRNFPDTIGALQFDSDALLADAEGALQLRIAYMIAVYVTESAESSAGAAIDPAEYMAVLNAMAQDGKLLSAVDVFAGQLAGDVAKAKAQEVAAAVFTDIVMAGPWPEMSPELQNMLRAGIDAAFKEGWDLMKAQNDPSVAVSMIFNRAKDIRDIMIATNALNKTQEQGLIQTALSMQTAAWLFVAYPDSPGTQMAVKGALADMQRGVPAIVGDDDGQAVTRIFSVGFGALRAAYRGETQRARLLVDDIRQMGAESNIPPLNLVDGLLAIANLGQDAPARAANIMIGVTDIADVDAIVPLEVARNPQPEPTATPPTSSSSSVWGPEIVVPENHPVWNRRYDRRQDQRSILAGLGVSKRAVAFSEAYDPEYVGDSFASKFVELGNVDLVRMRIGHLAETSDRFRPSAIVSGSVGVMAVRGPGTNLAAQFTDSTSRKFLSLNPQAIGMYAGAFHRKLPNGGQRFVALTGLQQACRNCPSIGTAVQFIDFDANGQFVAERNIGLVDESFAASFDESLTGAEGMTGWERTDFSANPKTLQYRLNMLGYDAGEVDGYPGPQTRQALMEFQVENCLSPSGQPKADTVAKLQKADGLIADCTGAPLPGISANNPLVPGTYVSDPAWCDRDAIPYDVVYDVQRIVRPDFLTFGLEDGFEIKRSDIVQGLTQLKGNFFAGNTGDPGTYLIDVLTPSRYREVRVGTRRTGTTFFKCANDSPLMTAEIGISDAQSDPSPLPGSRRTTTTKDTWVLDRAWRNNEPVYDQVRLAPAGESILVLGNPDAQGDCLVDSREGKLIKCSDLAVFAGQTRPIPAQVVTAAPSDENIGAANQTEDSTEAPQATDGVEQVDLTGKEIRQQDGLKGGVKLLSSSETVRQDSGEMLTIRQELIASSTECQAAFVNTKSGIDGFYMRDTTRMHLGNIDASRLEDPGLLGENWAWEDGEPPDLNAMVFFYPKNEFFDSEGMMEVRPDQVPLIETMYDKCDRKSCTKSGPSSFAFLGAENKDQAAQVRAQIAELAEQCSPSRSSGVRGQIDQEAITRNFSDYDYHTEHCRQPGTHGIDCRAWPIYKAIDDVTSEFDITLAEFLEWNGFPPGTPGYTLLETATWYVISDQPPGFTVTYGNPFCRNGVENGLICSAEVENTTFAELAGYRWENGEFLELNNLPADTDPNTLVPAYQMWAIGVARQ